MTATLEDTAVRPWVAALRVTSAVVIAATLVVQLLLARSVIPPLLVFEMLFAIGLVVLSRKPSTGIWMVGIVSVLFILGDIPFGGPELAHPNSLPTFATEVAQLGAAIVGVVLAVCAIRRLRPEMSKRILLGAGAVYVVLALTSAVLWVTASDVSARPGDIDLQAKSAKFRAVGDLTANAGTVVVHVDNHDPVRHNFTIDALHVNVDLPAEKGRRITFTAEPGTYVFHCTVPGHTDMKGSITVR
jgi:plastocyanin